MAVEIERKFLVTSSEWQDDADEGQHIRQGYLNPDKNRTVRVRTAGRGAFLTVKGLTVGIERKEFEYAIPVDDAIELLDMSAGSVIEKTRYKVPYRGMDWEVDVFEGDNAGLTVAEIELRAKDQQFEIPRWLGEEVSDDPRYLNVRLATEPYKNW